MMSTLERRLQVLLDEERFELLAAESRRSGRSVGSIVRSAIDVHFSTAHVAAGRAAAAHRLLSREFTGSEPDWVQSKAAIVADGDPATR